MVTWNKLVRDKIPDLMTKEGKLFRIKELKEGEYMDRLVDKLTEEAYEVASRWRMFGDKDRDLMAEELADVLQVVYTISNKFGYDKDQLEKIRLYKAEEKGVFNPTKSFITEVI